MAREYAKIYTRIWNDEKLGSISGDGVLAFLVVLTHPSLTGLGAMRHTKEGLAAEFKGLSEGLGKGFEEALSVGLLEYDENASLVAIPRFVKYNQPENPNVAKNVLSHANLLPECDLKSVVVKRFKDACKGFLKGSRKGSGTESPIPGARSQEPGAIIKDSTKVESSAELPSEAPTATAAVADFEKCGIVFPCHGKVKTYEPTKAKVAEWQDTYPYLDVPAELLKARQWIIDNPARRGTAKGKPSFIARWLNRAADSPRTARASPLASCGDMDDSVMKALLDGGKDE